jgi:hypothetical protein
MTRRNPIARTCALCQFLGACSETCIARRTKERAMMVLRPAMAGAWSFPGARWRAGGETVQRFPGERVPCVPRVCANLAGGDMEIFGVRRGWTGGGRPCPYPLETEARMPRRDPSSRPRFRNSPSSLAVCVLLQVINPTHFLSPILRISPNLQIRRHVSEQLRQ